MKDYDASKDPNYVDELLIGSITFSDKEYKIEVYSKEGAIPHFHINGVNSNFQSCVCIYSNNYFSHGGKYADTLNATQREELDKWLAKYNDKFTLYTNWELISILWDTSNPDCKFPASKKVSTKPDYTTIEGYKDK